MKDTAYFFYDTLVWHYPLSDFKNKKKYITNYVLETGFITVYRQDL